MPATMQNVTSPEHHGLTAGIASNFSKIDKQWGIPCMVRFEELGEVTWTLAGETEAQQC